MNFLPDAHCLQLWGPIPWVLVSSFSRVRILEWHLIIFVVLEIKVMVRRQDYFQQVWLIKRDMLFWNCHSILHERIFSFQQNFAVELDHSSSVNAFENDLKLFGFVLEGYIPGVCHIALGHPQHLKVIIREERVFNFTCLQEIQVQHCGHRCVHWEIF